MTVVSIVIALGALIVSEVVQRYASKRVASVE
jgi:hypothetical protein